MNRGSASLGSLPYVLSCVSAASRSTCVSVPYSCTSSSSLKESSESSSLVSELELSESKSEVSRCGSMHGFSRSAESLSSRRVTSASFSVGFCQREAEIETRGSIGLEGRSVPGPVNTGATAIDGFATGGDLDDLNITAVGEERGGTQGRIAPANKQVGEASRGRAQRCALRGVFSSE